MMQHSPGNIFLGNTPSAHRKWLSVFLARAKTSYSRLVIPCCGGFAIAEVAVKAGWKPSKIVTSDISLFTTLVARAVNKQAIDDLEIRFAEDSPIAQLCDPQDPIDVLYAIKLGTQLHKGGSVHSDRFLADLVSRKDDHMRQLASGIEEVGILAGMRYEIRDMFGHIREAVTDSKNVLWVNPPGYLKGYTKLYDWGGHIEWASPEFGEFNPAKDHMVLRDMLAGAPALAVRYRYKELDKAERDEAVFAVYKGPERYDYLLSNRPGEVKGLMGSLAAYPVDSVKPRANAVIPSDHPITAESRVEFRVINHDVASYYRDLFVHRLGTTQAFWNMMLVIDGYVAGVVGFGPCQNPKAQDRHRPEETFGITATYGPFNLNKLLMMLITSGEFATELQCFGLDVLGIKTTCLSQYPEMKINRGILKLTSRKFKKGMYILRYEADMRKDTYTEVVVKWLERESRRLKSQGTESQS